MKFARILVLYASFWEDIYILLMLVFENTFIYSEAQHIYVFEVTFIHTQLTSEAQYTINVSGSYLTLCSINF